MRGEKLVVGQIGCGAFAHSQHMPNVTARGDLLLKYCCDAKLESARQAAEKFGAEKAVTDYGEVVADPEVDFLMVATPHDMHLPIIAAAAERGKHVFCEKPMAMEVPEAWEIIRAVKHGKIKLCVDLNRRMAPSMQALRRRVLAQRENPRHSPWRYIELTREQFPEERCANLMIRIQDEGSSYRMIHLDPAHGGGSIIGETVHWLDLACWFFAPQVPTAITAWGSTRMTHGVNVKFSGGDSATICFDVCGTFDYPKEMFEVTCEAALFRNMFFVENRYYGMGGIERETFPLQFDGFAESCPGEGFDAYMKKIDLLHKAAGDNLKSAVNGILVDKGHRAMLDGFVRSIRENIPSPCDEYAGLQATLLAKLTIESIRTERTIPVLIEDLRPAIL